MYSGILKNTLNLLYSVKRLLISVDQTISSCDMRSWSYLIRKYLRLAVTSIDHKLSLIVNSVWSTCSVTVANTPSVKYVCLSKDDSKFHIGCTITFYLGCPLYRQFLEIISPFILGCF